jgi:Chaperone of endosialidase
MNGKHMNTKTNILFLAVTVFALACLAFVQKARAVSPAPDGGYPGGNTAEGQNALFSLTSGTYNTAVGVFSLRSTITGNFNTAIGAGTLLLNTGDENTAIGAAALLSNTTGNSNTASGSQALLSNTTGDFNTANGFEALYNNTTGDNNTASGYAALVANTTGIQNTATGVAALRNNIAGNYNTAHGYLALYSNASSYNTASGVEALFSNTTGVGNTATGYHALNQNTTGSANTANGVDALNFNTTGSTNTAFGAGALGGSTGSGNIGLGSQAGISITTADNVIAIGVQGANVNNSCFIGNIRGVTTANTDAIPVFIDSAGQLGTTSSSRRYKSDIQTMDKVSEAILALKPVTFHYKSDGTKAAQFGLIAEEVAEVDPDLVVRDKNGEIYTVRYDAVNAMLLNEFLKEHRKNEEQEATIAQLKRDSAAQRHQIETLTSGLQKVSDQLELSQPAPRAVVSNQ